jgi:hypothetical protein
MYTGKLDCWEDHEKDRNKNTHGRTWYSLYVLADYLDMFWLAKATLLRLRCCFEEGERFPGADDIEYVYENTVEASPLRELLVLDRALVYVDESEQGFEEEVKHWTETVACFQLFHCDVMKEVKHHIDLVECDRLVMCRFHFDRKPGRKKRAIR